MLDALFAEGLDAVRLNFSHGTHETHAETYRFIREAAARSGREVAVVQDLQGPKIRLGQLAGKMEVAKGEWLTLTARSIVGANGVVPTDYPLLATEVSVGLTILLDDGRVSVEVLSIQGDDIVCKVVNGGTLSSNKGVNVPGASLTMAAMTEKDRADVKFGLDLGVDFVALSFVRRASDVEDLRRFMTAHGRSVPIIAKIEKPQAVEAIDEIVAVADGVMVARGDLAIEASLEMIPAYQKKIIARANRAGKLVITATQMLESMTENPQPTRAEVTDVANAILDGTDAVMLSGETAIGKHPAQVVRWMRSIAAATEESLYPFEHGVRPAPLKGEGLERVTARIAAQAAREADAKAIVVFTRSGKTAIGLSDERPRSPILAFTCERSTMRRLALYWGVHAILVTETEAAGQLIDQAQQYLVGQRWASADDRIVLVRGLNVVPGDGHSVTFFTLASH